MARLYRELSIRKFPVNGFRALTFVSLRSDVFWSCGDYWMGWLFCCLGWVGGVNSFSCILYSPHILLRFTINL